MQIVEEERVEVCKDNNDHQQDMMMIQQIMNKGKRTKRMRLPSPLRLAIALPSSTSSSTGLLFDLATATTGNEFRRREEEENDDEDMANCLILLAQGHYHNNKASKSSHLASPNVNNTNNHLYECKTCNRCFPSFQALGGHRASHKKPKSNKEDHHHHHHQKQGGFSTSYFGNNDDEIDHNNDVATTSTTLTLQIPNRALLYNSRNNSVCNSPPTPKSKVHECSICGAEFTSGQALGGHMRRHRAFLTMSSSSMSLHESSPQEGKKVAAKNNALKLDLNLPAAPDHEDDNNNNKFAFQSKDKVIVFSAATSLVDCHY